MRDGFSIYDAHTHIGHARHSGRRRTAGDLLSDMDRSGVDRSLVIPFPVVENQRAAHDEIGKILTLDIDAAGKRDILWNVANALFDENPK